MPDVSTAAPATEPPSPPPPDAGARSSRPPRLWRSGHDRYLAGVAGGVGERLAVDPFYVRIALVVATLLLAGAHAPPLAALAYVAAWLLVAEPGSRPLAARVRDDGDARREVAVAVLLLGATAVLVPRLGPGGSTGLRLGVALFGLAVLLLATRPEPGRSTVRPPATPAPAGPGGGAGDDAGPGGGAGDDAGPVGDAGPPPPPPTGQPGPQPARNASGAASPPGTQHAPGRPSPWTRTAPSLPLAGAWRGRPRRPRREPALWPLAISALLLYAVVCVIIDQLLDPGLDPGVAVSGALLIVAAVLVTSTWRGRARSTIVLAVALLPLWAGFTLTGIERYPGVGERTHRPATATEAAAGFELGYGRTVVDLRSVPLGPGDELRTSVALTAGTARVRIPADARLVVTGDIGLGSISVNRHDRWDGRGGIVLDRTLDRRYGPIPSSCVLQPVGSVAGQGLNFTNASFDSLDELDAELRRRGWPAARPTDPPGPGDPGEWVLVGVDEQWQLCDPSAPAIPDDPATIVLDARLGIGTLEITRERPA